MQLETSRYLSKLKIYRFGGLPSDERMCSWSVTYAKYVLTMKLNVCPYIDDKMDLGASG